MNAVISISGVQGVHADEQDLIEFVTDGVYSRTESGYEINYRESELTGLYGTLTRIKVCPDSVTVERSGALTSTMVFRQGESSRFLYETPYGSATMGIKTRRINASMDDDGGELRIDYVVNMEHAVVSRNKLIMSVRPKS